MRYNVAQLLKEPVGAARSYQIEEEFTEPHRIADAVRGPLNLIRIHHGVLARARLDTRSSLTCGRCLESYSRASTLSIEEEFFPTIDLHTGRKLPTPAEGEGALLIDSSHTLDLTEVMRQYLLTDVPMKPLCRLGCPGLCAACGVNLNRERCGCRAGQVASRWGALAGLQNLGGS
jgi:uncharacterized protein